MSPGNLPCLAAARPGACALANNHALDFGRRGLADTLDALSGAGLRAAGAGRDAGQARRPVAVPVPGGGRVVIFSCGTGSGGVPAGWAAAPGRPGINYLPDLSDATADGGTRGARAAEPPGDVVVVSMHLGATWGAGRAGGRGGGARAGQEAAAAPGRGGGRPVAGDGAGAGQPPFRLPGRSAPGRPAGPASRGIMSRDASPRDLARAARAAGLGDERVLEAISPTARMWCGRSEPARTAAHRPRPDAWVFALGTAVERRSMNHPAAAVAVVAAAPSRLTGTPATRRTGCGGASTPGSGTSGGPKNGAQTRTPASLRG